MPSAGARARIFVLPSQGTCIFLCGSRNVGPETSTGQVWAEKAWLRLEEARTGGRGSVADSC